MKAHNMTLHNYTHTHERKSTVFLVNKCSLYTTTIFELSRH